MKFIQGDGSVKAVVVVGNKVFTAHQDNKIRVWKVSQRSKNVFRLVDMLPITKDYLGKFMKQNGKIKAWGKEGKKSTHCLKDGRWVHEGGSAEFVMGWEASRTSTSNGGDVQNQLEVSWKLVC
ncbi:hypothetical protein ACFX19_030108 [Malus domestica]